MKKLFFFALMMLAFVGCYDDTALWDQIKDHEARILKLETLCNQMNTNIASIQTIVNALQDKDYVTNVAPIKENGKEIGYTITFSKSGSVTIYHGQDGKDGANGQDGKDGKDGYTPVIGVKQDGDGAYYWTVDGNWLTDAAGNRIPTTGKDGVDGADGSDGKDGQDGADGVTPQLKIEESYWYISYNNGQTWDMLGKAVGEDGKDGAPGADGKDGDSFFKSVTQDDDNVYITLADGTEFTLPKAEPSYVTLDREVIGDDYVIFKGRATEKPVDLKVTVYYGKDKNLTLYNNEGKGTITEFSPDTYYFRLLLDGLESDTEYYYFTEIICDGKTTYGAVESFRTFSGLEYVDEYGVSRGLGIEIDGVVWAPVNCGYHPTDYKYGKHYQWGRKYGHGYCDDIYSDASSPVIEKRGVPLHVALSSNYAHIFYSRALLHTNDALWNAGSEENPVKTEYDPCPEGWRVPTKSELEILAANYSETTEYETQSGRWCSGSQEYTSDVPRVFFPYAGVVYAADDRGRGTTSGYFSSTIKETRPWRLNVSKSSGVQFMSGTLTTAFSVRCVKDDGYMMPVQRVTISNDSIALVKGESAFLYASIYPSDASCKEVFWYSSDELIATVDQNGVVTMVSEGSADIYAVAGMQWDICTVTLKQDTVPVEGDYVDEYGINHGQGVEIDGTVWAPVNCGYHKQHYKYGKLYQWGRMYGQGYYSSYSTSYNDATSPNILETRGEDGNPSYSRNSDYSDVFFMSSSKYEYDWRYPHNDYLWNMGIESNPIKTPNDPCPEGWRVPTTAELENLIKNYSDWTRNGGQYGYWFSGSVTYSTNVNRLFLPAAGYHHCESEEASSRNKLGEYMSSVPLYYSAKSVAFHERNVYASSALRANGLSVRCVKE